MNLMSEDCYPLNAVVAIVLELSLLLSKSFLFLYPCSSVCIRGSNAYIRLKRADSAAAIPPGVGPGDAGARVRLREVRRARALRGGLVPANQNRGWGWRCGIRVRRAGA